MVQRLQPMLTPHFASKIKILKTRSESILNIYCSCSMQKTAQKNIKYSRIETILKIGHHAKAIAHAKSSLWVKNLNSKKYVKIHITNHLQLFCAKSPLQKTLNIREMRPFLRSAIMQRLWPMQNPHSGSKIKIKRKKCQNPFYKSFTVVM